MTLKQIWKLTKDTFTQFIDDKGPRLGAALAFYTALSLSPLILVLVSLAGIAYGEQAARGEVAHQLESMVGEQGAQAIETLLAKQRESGAGILMTIIGVVTLLIGASGVFAELQDALNTVWNIEPEKIRGGIWGFVRTRLLAFLVVGGLGALIVASLLMSAALSSANDWMESQLSMGGWALRIGNQAISFLLTTVLFAFIFKLLPAVRPSWSDVRIGAVLTAALFTVGKYLIGLYLGQAAPGSPFGAAGSFVALLIWIYYSAQILLLGAEFTQVYSNRRNPLPKAA